MHKQKKYFESLEYLNIALQNLSNDVGLLLSKAWAFLKLREYSQAIASYKQVLKLSPENEIALLNISEILLFNSQFDDYLEITKRIKNMYEKEYLDTLYLAIKEEEQNIKTKIIAFLSKFNDQTKTVLFNWDFTDLKNYFVNKPDTNCKKIILGFADFVAGKLNKNELLKLMN